MRKLLVWAAAAVMWSTQGWASGEPPSGHATKRFSTARAAAGPPAPK